MQIFVTVMQGDGLKLSGEAVEFQSLQNYNPKSKPRRQLGFTKRAQKLKK